MGCCKTKCCKTFFKVLTIILAIMDIGVGWFKFHELYFETVEIERELDHASEVLQSECSNPQLYWKIYAPFESIGTILGVIEIYYLVREIIEDKHIFNKCFNRTFFLVVFIYVFAVFPSTILDIVFRDRCICHEGFSWNIWQAEVRDFFKGFLGGVSVIFLQILLHLTEIFYRARRVWRFIGSFIFCVKYKEKDEEGEEEHKILPCFVISIILVICYAALFTAEIVFIFCNKHE